MHKNVNNSPSEHN